MVTITLRSMTVKFGKPVLMVAILFINVVDAVFDIISISRSIKLKDGKVCRTVQRLSREQKESLVQLTKLENNSLQQRIQKCENCMEEMMIKVTKSIGLESIINDIMTLQNKVHQLEEQNAFLLKRISRDLNMASASPMAIVNHDDSLQTFYNNSSSPTRELLQRGFMILEDDSCDLNAAIESDTDSILKMGDVLTSTMIESQSKTITQLLKDTIVYSDDDDITYKEFTKEFYYL